ncbi:protein TRACHEARY ELEMENT DIFFERENTIATION-RELATED 7A-like [Impatiens glandulifera]|uniref:protein TRACHEARY ELEMENT DIFFERENTIATION-RELATED 7A-like n=1 Tax=Impatiens glandulifera TaxID=253017 RepID=UPI001FB169AF|nr:protein TRACHEARY ELEMENT DIFFERENTIATION-RELATED 7A-like [Impatiens glandulifera]
MAFVQNYGFPFYSPPPSPPSHSPFLPPPYHPSMQPPPSPSHPTFQPPPPSHPTLPPPPSHPLLPPPSPPSRVPPPPSHPLIPPPTPPSRVPPSPPHHLLPPPPPHHFTPPPPSLPPPSPGHHTIIIVVFVSLGGLFLLGCLSFALCCFLKKRKKKQINETEIVRVDEHLKIQEVVVPGPHGTQTVILNIDEDIHVEEEINKNELKLNKGSHHDHAITSESPQSKKAVEIAIAAASDTIQHYHDHKKS